MVVSVMDLEEGKTAKIVEILGGCGVQNQLRSIGILEGKDIAVVTHHPFKGPIVVKVDRKMIPLAEGLLVKSCGSDV
jgi:ferrous iron transport protein A